MTRKVKLDVVPTEQQDQIKLAVWLWKQGIKFNASANGGSRNYLEAAKLKRMGVSSGFPDLEIPIPSGPYHGLYIELKRVKGGVVSESQREWLSHLNKNGYFARVAKGFEEARDLILYYLSLTPSAA